MTEMNNWFTEPVSPEVELAMALVFLVWAGMAFYVVVSTWSDMREDAAMSEAMRLLARPLPAEYLCYHLLEGRGWEGWWSGLHPGDIARARDPEGNVQYRYLIRMTRARRARYQGEFGLPRAFQSATVVTSGGTALGDSVSGELLSLPEWTDRDRRGYGVAYYLTPSARWRRGVSTRQRRRTLFLSQMCHVSANRRERSPDSYQAYRVILERAFGPVGHSITDRT